ncbi:MAG: NirD/YgiW/YdeI family stress tolerance protein [Aliarcobacter skirrowii]|nr:NirD/YgiW/YdeI family stress tolerance protein [Aliarcobacter skirrowii]
MKKSIILASMLFISTSIFAQSVTNLNEQKGGFIGSSAVKVTVKEAKELKDDTPVVLEGNIIKHLEKDKYIFKDNTGEIKIEIDEDDWGGLIISEEDTVIIYGEVDKYLKYLKIDVDSIIKK